MYGICTSLYYSNCFLLQTPSPASSIAGHLSGTPNSSNLPSPVSDSGEDSRLSSYLHQLAGHTVSNTELIMYSQSSLFLGVTVCSVNVL